MNTKKEVEEFCKEKKSKILGFSYEMDGEVKRYYWSIKINYIDDVCKYCYGWDYVIYKIPVFAQDELENFLEELFEKYSVKIGVRNEKN